MVPGAARILRLASGDLNTGQGWSIEISAGEPWYVWSYENSMLEAILGTIADLALLGSLGRIFKSVARVMYGSRTENDTIAITHTETLMAAATSPKECYRC